MRPINMLVLHYTGMQSAEAALDRLCDPEAQVSSHYLVEEDGTVWRLVAEERRAFHAGVSCWLGEQRSERRLDRDRDRQSRPRMGLPRISRSRRCRRSRRCAATSSRAAAFRRTGSSAIPTSRPTARSDPGELFDWPRLARAGIGLWPPSPPDIARRRGRGVGVVHRTAALSDLARIGYCVSRGTEQIALAAFQRRFRPERWDGLLDARNQPAAARRAARGRGGAGRRGNTAAQPRFN